MGRQGSKILGRQEKYVLTLTSCYILTRLLPGMYQEDSCVQSLLKLLAQVMRTKRCNKNRCFRTLLLTGCVEYQPLRKPSGADVGPCNHAGWCPTASLLHSHKPQGASHSTVVFHVLDCMIEAQQTANSSCMSVWASGFQERRPRVPYNKNHVAGDAPLASPARAWGQQEKQTEP